MREYLLRPALAAALEHHHQLRVMRAVLLFVFRIVFRISRVRRDANRGSRLRRERTSVVSRRRTRRRRRRLGGVVESAVVLAASPLRADGASPVLGSPRARAARKLRGRGRDREVPRRVRDRTGRRERLVRAAPRRDAADAGALPGHVRDVRSSRPTRRARARARRDARARRRRQAVRRAHRRRRRHPRRSSTARALADPATSPIDPAFPLTQARGDVNQKHPRRPIGPATRPSARRTPACAARPAGVRRGKTNARRVYRRPFSRVSTPLRVPDRPSPSRAFRTARAVPAASSGSTNQRAVFRPRSNRGKRF